MKGYIVVKQFLKGDWVNLISLETLEDINQEQIDEALGTMKDLIFDADKVNISNETSVVIFNRNDGPVKIDYVVEPEPVDQNYLQV